MATVAVPMGTGLGANYIYGLCLGPLGRECVKTITPSLAVIIPGDDEAPIEPSDSVF